MTRSWPISWFNRFTLNKLFGRSVILNLTDFNTFLKMSLEIDEKYRGQKVGDNAERFKTERKSVKCNLTILLMIHENDRCN